MRGAFRVVRGALLVFEEGGLNGGLCCFKVEKSVVVLSGVG